MSRRHGLAADFVDHVRERGFFQQGDRLLVAVSGGLDSLTLLHLLRFAPGLPEVEIEVAHFDHLLRPESPADALWVAGWAGAWGLECTVGRADRHLGSEALAREARYDFLEAERQRIGARWLLTAHHADDQAETVLFRIVRGTGTEGLVGIAEQREPGVLRPLLPFTRSRIAEYASSVGIEPRVDPTNADPRFARNVLRNEVLPRLEAAVSPGVRAALVRLSGIAREEERAWSSILERVREDVVIEAGEGRIVVDRTSLLEYDSAVRARLLRTLVRRFGVRLDQAATRAATAFAATGASGREHRISGSLRLMRFFDRLVLESVDERREDRPLEILEAGLGRGDLVIGGRSWSAEWSPVTAPVGGCVERFSLSGLDFPIRIRGWTPGDRMRFSYGSKKLKKVFAEARVPRDERSRVPVIADGSGRVLWVAGVGRSSLVVPTEGEDALTISLSEAP